jgi:hypothetical protein
MRRPLLIALLAFGAVAGYASGFAHLHHWCAWHHPEGACHGQSAAGLVTQRP